MDLDSTPKWLVVAKPPIWLHGAMYRGDCADPRRGPDLLHMTVLNLGPWADLGCDLGTLMDALDKVEADPVSLVLDQLKATTGGTAALLGSRSGPAQRLRVAVIAALRRKRIRFPDAGRIRPHVTLRYGWQKPGLKMAIEPILWLIDELLLIESLTGTATHRLHGRFRIVPRQGLLFPLTHCSTARRIPAAGTLASPHR